MTDARLPRPDPETLMAQRDSLRHLARGLVLDEHRAEDVVHDAWVAALEKPPEPRAPLGAWLASVVRNVAANVVRRESQRPTREAGAARPELVEPGEERDLELQEEVVACLRRLRQPYRTALYLRYFKDLPPRDIARQQGLPLATVKTHLRRGLALLREDLDQRNGGERSAWCSALLGIAGPGIDPTAVAWDLLRAARPSDVVLAAATTPATASLGSLLIVLAATLGWRLSSAPVERSGSTSVPAVVAQLEPAGRGESVARSKGSGTTEPDGAARRVALGPLPLAADGADYAPGIVGQVLDEEDRPVVGALVSTGSSFAAADLVVQAGAAFALTRTRAITAEADVRQTHVFATATDAEGRFEFPASARHAARLNVRAAGFAELNHDLPLETGRTLDVGRLPLRTGAILVGRVVDERGQPLAGATLCAQSAAGLEACFEGGAAGAAGRVETAADGRFHVDTLAPGRWTFVVSAPGHVPRTFEGSCMAQERAEREFVLSAGAELSGHVAGPVPADTWVRLAQTDRDGGLFGAVERVAVEPDGTFRAIHAAVGSRQALDLVDGAGQPLGPVVEVRAPTTGIELAWDASASLELSVRDARTGAPVAATATWIEEASGAWTRTVVQGELVWSALRPGRTGRLVVRAPGYATSSRTIPLGAGERRSVAFELTPVPLLTVAVVDRWGRPLEGAALSLDSARAEAERSSISLLLFDALGPLFDAPRTDGTGRARLSVDDAGDLPRLRVEAPGHVPVERELSAADLALGRVDVRLEPAGCVALEVRDAGGRPISGALVVIERADAEDDSAMRLGLRRARTDANGHATLRDVEPGTVRLRAGQEGDARVLDVRSGAIERVVLTGERTVAVAGTVRVAGRALAGAEVNLTPLTDPDTFVVVGSLPGFGHATDEQGRFRASGLAPGTYTVEVTHRDRAMPARFTRTLDPGAAQLDLDLDLGTVSGRVVDAAGRPLANASVRARYAEDDTRVAHVVFRSKRSLALQGAVVRTEIGTPQCQTAADGRYELVGVATDAPVEIVAEAQGHAPSTSEPFHLEPYGARRDVLLALGAGGRITVAVTDAGRPSAGAIVLAQPGEGVADQLRSATTDRDGRAVFDDLAPGRWTISGLSALELGAPMGGATFDGGSVLTVSAGRTEHVEWTR